LALGLAFIGAAGCNGGGDEGNTKVPVTKEEHEAATQKQIEAIKNNKYMTDAQKAQAIGAYTMNQAKKK
jgi:hypothetical protein